VTRIRLAGEEDYVSANSAGILLLVPVEGKNFDNSVVAQFAKPLTTKATKVHEGKPQISEVEPLPITQNGRRTGAKPFASDRGCPRVTPGSYGDP
jgi:hypothetical protein